MPAGDLVHVDIAGGSLLVGDKAIVGFPVMEARILDALVRRMPMMLPRQALMDILYGSVPGGDAPDHKIIDVYICRIRRKLADTRLRIETKWRIGWRLVLELPKEEAA